MSTDAPARHSIQQIIGIALRGELTDELAAIASAMGPEATCAVMLAASRRIAELVGASATMTTATTSSTAAAAAPGPQSPALQKFFTEAFEGVLIHDFWRPYESVWLEGDGDHQCCLVHLLRELDHVDEHSLPSKAADEAASWGGSMSKGSDAARASKVTDIRFLNSISPTPQDTSLPVF